jgi:hypothetical protein
MRTISLLAVLSIFAALPARSKADPIVIYNNFGPGQTYGPDAWAAVGPTNPVFPGVQSEVALSFTPTTTSTFDAVLLPLAYNFGTNSVNVSLTADASGHPGTTLESFSLTGLPTFPTGAVYQLNSVTDPLLTAGDTYWITFSPGASDTLASWFQNSTGVIGFSGSSDGGNTWNVSANPAPTMEVEGQLLVTPEPSSLVMLAVGMCTMGWSGWTWRRRQSAPR